MTSRRLSMWGRNKRLPRLLLIPLLSVFLVTTLFALYFSTFGYSRDAHASGPVRLTGHVPGLISKSRLLGPTDPSTPITLVVGMQPRDAARLQAYADAVSRPRSSLTGHYLTPEEVGAAFGALPSSEDSVIMFMQQAGFKAAMTYKHHLLVSFKGTIGQAEHAFNVQINNYRAPSGREYYAPTMNPSVPGSLAPIIESIIGLDDAQTFSHPPVHAPKQGRSHGASPRTSCPVAGPGYFLPSQIATAYHLSDFYNANMHGEGQTVALFELDDYDANDIATYTACFGGGFVPIIRTLVGGGTGAPPDQGAIEVELDMELVLSATPNLTALKVYEAKNDVSDALAEYSQIVNDNVPVVSTSWGSCESSGFAQAVYSEENTLFTAAAAQGQSIFAAAGDAGSNDCLNNTPTPPSVDDPASQPYITGVGGTKLTLNSNNSYGSEVVWNEDAISGGAGGGGVSAIWKMPAWQRGPGVINTTYSSGIPCSAGAGNYCREVPDVSLNADPYSGYAMYCTVVASGGSGPCDPNNPWFPIGGTSAAAPMWAAMTALANEKSINDGNAKLGFLNPFLYQVGKSGWGTSYGNDFHDITVGNNYTTGDGKAEYPATVNYDMASGLGSYKGLSLASDLESLQKVENTLPPTSKLWYFAEGRVGQGFSEFLTFENPDLINQCSVNIEYLLNDGSIVNKSVSVLPSTRLTESVNTDLSITSTSSATKTVAATVTTTNSACNGIVAERPMYFTNFAGINSGTDALGTTRLGQSFDFASVSNMPGFSSFITILNPAGGSTATVTARYYAGGSELSGSPQTVTVQAGSRGTIVVPRFSQRVTALVTSNVAVAVERVTYFHNVSEGNAQMVSGASVVGGESPSARLLFAEGYTGPGYQENLVLSDPIDTQPITATVVLEYAKSHTQTVHVTVKPADPLVIDVNALHDHPTGVCDTNPCQASWDVSVDITTTSLHAILAEREMFFHYSHQANGRNLTATGGSDVAALTAGGNGTAPLPTVYSFAEGYTNVGFDEWLTLLNPTASSETIAVTLINEKGRSYIQNIPVGPHSRATVDITGMVIQHLYQSGDGVAGYELSMIVQSSNGAFVAERPMYFNTGANGWLGGDDVIGFNSLS